ncbi:MAG: hypothetical protein RI996_242 [Candidatus Parcubacteria bacterium]|jgi:hypothetical protein
MNFNKAPELIPQQESHTEEPSLLQKMGELSPQIVSFLAVLSASNAAFAADLEANTVQQRVQNALVSTESNIDTRLEISTEVDSVTRERFGVSIYDVCEQTGCGVNVVRPSTNGKYIIHMGQSHERPPSEVLTGGFEYKILESQEIIYNTLLALNNPTVIEEGFTNADDRVIPKTIEEARGELFVREQIINSQKFGVKEFQNYIIHRFNLTEEPLMDTTYTLPEDMQTLLSLTEQASQQELNSINDSNVSRIINRLSLRIEDGEVKKNEQNKFTYKLPFSDNIDQSTLFAIGAIYKLQIDGKQMTVLPGETDELNDAASSALARGDSMGFENAQEARDNYAVAAAVKTGDSATIIVYGSNHKLNNNLEQNSASGYGVIEIQTNIQSRIVILDQNGVELGTVEEK